MQVTNSLQVPNTGLHVLSPAGPLARNYLIGTATFGKPHPPAMTPTQPRPPNPTPTPTPHPSPIPNPSPHPNFGPNQASPYRSTACPRG